MCDAVELPGRIRYEGQPLTKEQAQKLLETARGHRLEVLLTVAVTTGMRQGELFFLRWKDINFQSTSVYVQFVFEMLKQHRSQLEEMRVKVGDAWIENDLVFPNLYGGFLDKGNFHGVFQKLLKKADLPQIRFHDLRHSAATILLSMGVNIKVIQNLLGHSTIKTTLDTYGHVLPSMHDDAMDKWDDLLGE